MALSLSFCAAFAPTASTRRGYTKGFYQQPTQIKLVVKEGSSALRPHSRYNVDRFHAKRGPVVQVCGKADSSDAVAGYATANISELEQTLLLNRLANGTTPVPKVPIEIVQVDNGREGIDSLGKTAICGPSNFVAIQPPSLVNFPYYAMCKLYMTWIDNNRTNWRYIASGFAIGPDTVATAAHCVFDYEKREYPNKGWADAVEVFPAMYGPKRSLTGTPRNAKKFGAFKGWTESAYPGSLPWDGAVMRVDGDLGLPKYISIEKGPDEPGRFANVTLLGYPGCLQRGEYPYATIDIMEIGLDKDYTYEHQVDICGGNSGGPALLRTDDKAFAINVAERLQVLPNGQRIPVCPNTSTALGFNIKLETLLALV